MFSLQRFEELRLNYHFLDGASRDIDSKPITLQQITELNTVYEIDGRGTVASGFIPRPWAKCSGGDNQPLLTSPRHSSTKIPNRSCRDAPLITLALEIRREAHQRHPIHTHAVDASVVRLLSHFHVSKACLTQKAARQASKRPMRAKSSAWMSRAMRSGSSDIESGDIDHATRSSGFPSGNRRHRDGLGRPSGACHARSTYRSTMT